MEALSEPDEITFAERGALASVTLERPKALNALSRDLIRAFDLALQRFAAAETIKAVSLAGAGDKAFCAGGDVRAIWEAGSGPFAAAFFAGEYRLIRRIKRFPKPVVALMDGYTMGGGAGIAINAALRVATEKTLFAMPECVIGFVPDVGASYFLSRLPGRLGAYLSLTGARLGAADLCFLGLADSYVPSQKLSDLIRDLRDAQVRPEDLVKTHGVDPGPAPLEQLVPAIDRCFESDDPAEIMARLSDEKGDWACQARAAMAAASPTSLYLALECLRRGAGQSFEENVIMEYRLSQSCLEQHDFCEGIRAQLIDRDKSPCWKPARLADVSDELVALHFEVPPVGDLNFPD
jgi:enoyl-CoA hydratase